MPIDRGILRNSRTLAATSALALAVGLSGCVSGATYGTGVPQEKQLVKDLTNMFTLKNGGSVKYETRPGLVEPADPNNLPLPIEEDATASGADWPETPQERIAKVRADAVQPHVRSGQIPVEELLRKKESIANSADLARQGSKYYNERRPTFDGDLLMKEWLSEKSGEEVKRRRAELAPAETSEPRKYLTDPPDLYRTPADSAPIGDVGMPEDQKRALEEKKKSFKISDLFKKKDKPETE